MVFTFSSTISFAEVTRDRSISFYDPDIYNDPTEGQDLDSLQHRTNCYGYSIRCYYQGELVDIDNDGYLDQYKQQPGEFALDDYIPLVRDNIILDNPTESMTNVLFNMACDGESRGYNLYYYNLDPGEKPKIYAGGHRVIALVTGNTDYHFYMQHRDGTWSHKPGSGKVTNLSIDDKVPLTNDNIIEKANQGIYTNGELQLIIVSKDAIVDRSHSSRFSSDHVNFYPYDHAGKFVETAEDIYLDRRRNSQFDYHVGEDKETNDTDVFCFKPTTSGDYRFSVQSDVDTDGILGNDNLETLKVDTSSGDVDITYYLIANQEYYLVIYNYNKTYSEYKILVEKS